ncbi:hypothetical protein [Novosphingobium malaysiense]|uniref:Uncharacterized protein n=1 Tax=Novosphingobium malaysiense TaxID=1348853 RepID=A0A0B1ZE19_9SPHN|nr:hypothetical protein [Novosphingobium malaysiense]KHK89309.1 hypothetical protein LK12_19365 [Novosphingobium malaysiense]
MKLAAFELTTQPGEAPVTVFAKSEEQAEVIYREWRRHHRRHDTADTVLTYAYRGQLLAARPLLAACAARGEPGIAYWDELYREWSVEQPASPVTGDLTPLAGTNEYYRVDTDKGDVVLVFAASPEEATTSTLVYFMNEYGEAPTYWQMRRQSRWSLVLAMAVLRDQMEAGVRGVATWSQDDGWSITEPAYGMDVSELGI